MGDDILSSTCPRCFNRINFTKDDIFTGFIYGSEVFIIDCEICDFEIVISHYDIHTI